MESGNRQSQLVHSPPFTPQEEQTLVALRAEGQTFKRIAEQLPGQTLYSVAHRLYLRARHTGNGADEPSLRNGELIKPHYTLDEDEKLIQLRDSGLSWNKIAAQLRNRTGESVRKRYWLLKYFPLPSRRI